VCTRVPRSAGGVDGPVTDGVTRRLAAQRVQRPDADRGRASTPSTPIVHQRRTAALLGLPATNSCGADRPDQLLVRRRRRPATTRNPAAAASSTA
jgi:hypothetical protein